MHDNRRRFIIPVVILVCALGLGIAYAATTGLLTFNGTAVINPNAAIRLSAFIVTGKDEDTIDVTNNEQTITFTTRLDYKNDYAVINVAATNNGNVPLLLDGFTNTTTPPDGITVTWPAAFTGKTLPPGQTTNTEPIRVEWTGGATLAPDSYTFSATMSYSQVT